MIDIRKILEDREYVEKGLLKRMPAEKIKTWMKLWMYITREKMYR